jgi:hypothetical protein
MRAPHVIETLRALDWVWYYAGDAGSVWMLEDGSSDRMYYLYLSEEGDWACDATTIQTAAVVYAMKFASEEMTFVWAKDLSRYVRRSRPKRRDI